MIRILIADDEKNLRRVLKNELSEDGYAVSEAANGAIALDLLEKKEYDVLLLDINMPGLSGLDVLRRIKDLDIPPETIVLTANTTISSAVEAMKLGACDYISKPFRMDELKTVIGKAYDRKRLITENLLLKSQIKMQSPQKGIITGSPVMLELLETVKKVASSDYPVLIYGESGTGKELIARAIHDASDRSEGPFIPINCGAIPENMIESEFFGHEKGAFTGAVSKKLGLLEISNRGTLFLDEIGELPLQLQVKLLRVIEEKTFFRVGGIKQKTVDVKFLCATNKDLKTEISNNRFRHDLYYRISALTLYIPPLSARKDDIPLLVDYFSKNNPAFRHKRFSKEAIDVLSAYSWPGNVRELLHVVHRALLLSKTDLIVPTDLSADLTLQPGTGSSRRLSDVEREHILNVLKVSGGQKGKAAEILGIDPKTLYRKLMDYGVRD